MAWWGFKPKGKLNQTQNEIEKLQIEKRKKKRKEPVELLPPEPNGAWTKECYLILSNLSRSLSNVCRTISVLL